MPRINGLFARLVLVVVVAALCLAASQVAPARAQDGYRRYVVQPGDTLTSIAARFGVSPSDLATINGLYDVNRVYVGQILVIPKTVINPPAPKPQTYPVVYPVSPPATYYPPGTTVTTVTRYSTYIVRKGDTLASVAARYNVSIASILSANYIPDPNILWVGQRLTIVRTSTSVVPAPRPVSGRIYYVQPGDTLFSIAARFRRDVYAIARANGLLNLNAIYAGQALVIPN